MASSSRTSSPSSTSPPGHHHLIPGRTSTGGFWKADRSTTPESPPSQVGPAAAHNPDVWPLSASNATTRRQLLTAAEILRLNGIFVAGIDPSVIRPAEERRREPREPVEDHERRDGRNTRPCHEGAVGSRPERAAGPFLRDEPSGRWPVW